MTFARLLPALILSLLVLPACRSVTFAVSFDDRPGMWMFHCHILDHAEPE